MRNASLNAAGIAKNDEFYTCYADIEKELNQYAKYFKGKIIYCNCDDHAGISLGTPKSNFLKYFADNFEAFGIKKVIATHYEKNGSSNMYILDKDNTGDGVICSEDIEEIPLKNNGDFRSEECIKLLQQADIVVTNPPFSLFREYVAQLMEYHKKFIIIGNDNCRTYKEIFPLIQNNKMWCGYNHVKKFIKPNGETQQFGNVGWYTNLSNSRRNEKIDTGKKYYGYEHMYPKYDNYDAIEVSKTSDIPMDYYGVMGVPITFIDKYNPEQFDIIGITDRQNTSGLRTKKYTEADDARFNDLNARSVLKTETGYCAVYARILIRRKKDN
ncbi:MAG: modification methylase [Alphaproteobacteria bacterium]|nr:modification methylase [Alphaproteobacteria bacterium]